MLNKNLALIALAVFAAGCGLETRTYVITRDRVGLNQSGNGGCIMGKCDPPPPPTETTRKVYVLEITRPVPESEVQKIEQTAVNVITEPPTDSNATPVDNTPAAAPADTTTPPVAPDVVVPVIGETPGSSPSPSPETSTAPATPAADNGGNVQGQTYTVQKDDTLQKISKKIFGTYSKWYKIYEANKDKIKNPNFVKPGTVLTIPAIK